MDECYERDGVCRDGDCTNLDGGFQCVCHSGYALTASRDTCVDVDECGRHPNVCNNGTCLNTVGSFKCSCFDGFKLSHNNDCIGTSEGRVFGSYRKWGGGVFSNSSGPTNYRTHAVRVK